MTNKIVRIITIALVLFASYAPTLEAARLGSIGKAVGSAGKKASAAGRQASAAGKQASKTGKQASKVVSAGTTAVGTAVTIADAVKADENTTTTTESDEVKSTAQKDIEMANAYLADQLEQAKKMQPIIDAAAKADEARRKAHPEQYTREAQWRAAGISEEMIQKRLADEAILKKQLEEYYGPAPRKRTPAEQAEEDAMVKEETALQIKFDTAESTHLKEAVTPKNQEARLKRLAAYEAAKKKIRAGRDKYQEYFDAFVAANPGKGKTADLARANQAAPKAEEKPAESATPAEGPEAPPTQVQTPAEQPTTEALEAEAKAKAKAEQAAANAKAEAEEQQALAQQQEPQQEQQAPTQEQEQQVPAQEQEQQAPAQEQEQQAPVQEQEQQAPAQEQEQPAADDTTQGQTSDGTSSGE